MPAVTFKSNADKIALNIRRRGRTYGLLTMELVTLESQEALKIAKELSGTRHYSTQELARMGHPYAAANPRPPMDPSIINRQSGTFVSGWGRALRKVLMGATGTIYNRTPYAHWLLDGTTRMIPRPILLEIGKRIGLRHAALYANLWRRMIGR